MTSGRYLGTAALLILGFSVSIGLAQADCLEAGWLFEGTGADETGQHNCTLHGDAQFVPTPGGQGLYTQDAPSFAEYAPPIDQIADGRLIFEFALAETFGYSPTLNNPIVIINSNRSGHMLGDFSVRLDPTDGRMWFVQEEAVPEWVLKTNVDSWEPVWYSVVIEWSAAGRSIDVQWQGGSDYVSDAAVAPCFSSDATLCTIASRATDSPQTGLTIDRLEVWCGDATPTKRISWTQVKSFYK